MPKHYQEAMAIARMGLWEWDVLTNETKWSDDKFILFGYEPHEFELTMENAFKTVHPDDQSKIFKILEEKLPNEDYFDYEYRGIKKNEEVMYVWVRVNVKRGKKGEPLVVYGISQDITERKKLERKIKRLNNSLEKKVHDRTIDLEKKNREKELLMREMHHRVKNNLQIISSILSLQQNYLSDNKLNDVLQQSVRRIKSMAIIHDSLYSQSNLEEIRLKNYINRLFGLYIDESRDIKVEVDVPDCALTIAKMVPLGLLMNELIANSIKHAFDDEQKGFIEMKIELSDSFKMVYRDNGKGMQNKKIKGKVTFGMELIDTLCADLEADYSFTDDEERGMKFNFETNFIKN